MIANLKPYKQYRTTEAAWLGEVPANWKVQRFKYLLAETDSRSRTGHEQLLRVSQYSGVTQRLALDGGSEPDTRAKSLIGYKKVEPNQLVVNIMLAWNGSLGVSRYEGIASPAYCVYKFKPNAEPFYFHYLLRSQIYKARIKALSTGVVESRLRLYSDKLFAMEAILPPPEEQAAIVMFLDWANGRIDRAIRAKKKVIALLNEQKRAIIHKAVTRGLNPKISVKFSGVPRIGMIPAHWEITRIKNEFLCLNSKRVPLSASERGQMQSRTYDYYGASGVIDKVDGFIFDDELLLIAEDGANLVLRNLPLAIIATGKFWVNNHAHILKPKKGNIYFLQAALECINYLPWISGAAQPKLTKDRLLAVSLAVPSRAEQDEIVNAFTEQTLPISNEISRFLREIKLLQEYRTRLTLDVVTGKIDVRSMISDLSSEESDVDGERLFATEPMEIELEETPTED